MNKTDLLKQHDEILEKVMKKEIETFGDGLRSSAYSSRDTKKHSITAVQQAFRNSFKLQLNTIPSPIMEREQTFRLCRGQELRVHLIEHFIKTYWPI